MEGRHQSSEQIGKHGKEHLGKEKGEYLDRLRHEGLTVEEKKSLLEKIENIDMMINLLGEITAENSAVFTSIDTFVQRSSTTEGTMQQNLQNIEVSTAALLADYRAEVLKMDKATMKSILEDIKTNTKNTADAVKKANDDAAEGKSLTWDQWTMLGIAGATLIATIGIGIGIGLKPSSDSGNASPSLDDLMEYIETIKALLSSGKISQDSVWAQIADYLDKDINNKITIDNQITALTIIQTGLVNLQETKDFSYLDEADKLPLLSQLQTAYDKAKKISDVYREAMLLRYQDARIPFYYTAALLQTELGIIRYQLNHTNTNTYSSDSASLWNASMPKVFEGLPEETEGAIQKPTL